MPTARCGRRSQKAPICDLRRPSGKAADRRSRVAAIARPEFTIRTVFLLAALLCAVLLLLASGANAARSNTRECQHPLTTGQEAVKIRNVAPKTACKAVRQLARFIEDGTKPERLYRCVGTHGGTRAGRPVLEIHHFRGWKLTVVQKYGLQMSRGAGSFDVTGTDFPLNCT